MINKIKELWIKYKSLINYGIFGVITTVINIGAYSLCYEHLGINNVVSNIIAWVLAVTVAYITNKIWVFDSKSLEPSVLVREVISFFGCRVATGIIDLAIMYVAVDCMGLNSTLTKCISNVIVIVANYVASKLIIFKKQK